MNFTTSKTHAFQPDTTTLLIAQILTVKLVKEDDANCHHTSDRVNQQLNISRVLACATTLPHTQNSSQLLTVLIYFCHLDISLV